MPRRIAPATRPRLAAPVTLAVVAAALGVFAIVAGHNAAGLRGSTAAHNTALTDTARTSEANGQITAAVAGLFSYDYAHPEKNRQATRTFLAGNAVAQYQKLFAPVLEQAGKQQLVLATTVTESGVSTIQGDRAHLLVFANERNTAVKTGQTVFAGAMLAVDATYRGGKWRVTGLDSFTE
jgi:Mce-associated membrane protein